MEHLGTQALRTERLVLRRIVPEDANQVFGWMGDPEVCRYERWNPHPSTGYSRGYIFEALDYSSDRTYHWGIEYEGSLVGYVCAACVDDFDRKATLGYAVARACWSQGIATEAVREVLRFLFLEVGLNRVEASHSVNNPASGRVLEKCGLNREGLAREYYFSNSGVQDSYLYGLARTAYLDRGKERAYGKERYLTRSAVMLFLLREREVLLQKRQNTGYADGMWDFACSGHVDGGESMRQAMAREAREELGVRILPQNLEFATLTHKNTPGDPDGVYYNGYFSARSYVGEPQVNEPEKCAELRWFPLDKLPEELLPDRRAALENYLAGVPYSEMGWEVQSGSN